MYSQSYYCYYRILLYSTPVNIYLSNYQYLIHYKTHVNHWKTRENPDVIVFSNKTKKK